MNEFEHSRWVYLFYEGLIDSKTANLWADEVWCPSGWLDLGGRNQRLGFGDLPRHV